MRLRTREDLLKKVQKFGLAPLGKIKFSKGVQALKISERDPNTCKSKSLLDIWGKIAILSYVKNSKNRDPPEEDFE